MNRTAILTGAALGVLTALPVMAILYLGEQFAMLPFVPFDLFDWLARVLPGDIIRLVIGAMVSVIQGLQLGETSSMAKLIEQLMALGTFVAIGAALGAVVGLVGKRGALSGTQTGIVAGLAAFLPLFLISVMTGGSDNPMLALAWLMVVFAAWGWTLGWALERRAQNADPALGASRRTWLGRLAGGSAALTLAGFGLGRALASATASSGAGRALPGAETGGATGDGAGVVIGADAPMAVGVPSDAELANRIAPAPGTRPELTDNDNFYRIDINTRPVVIQEADWRLEVHGLFDNPRNFTLAELMAYPAVTQPLTMGCISNRVGGDLIGTSNWTGLPFSDFVRELGIQPQATALLIEGADGFYETVSREDWEDPRTLLVYGMNGETLPVEHGFPLRIYIPDRYGMKQPKWITRMEAISDPEPGYWVVRGWSREARPQTVSVIDAVEAGAAQDGTVPFTAGGIAWAGARGIVKVEVRVDEGEWQDAQLRTPTLSPLTWVQWRFEGSAPAGARVLTVRATDGTNTLQTERQQPVAPDGATGYHTKMVRL